MDNDSPRTDTSPHTQVSNVYYFLRSNKSRKLLFLFFVLCPNYLLRLEEGFRSASREAEALRRNNYREPILNDKYGFHLAFDTESNFWEYTTKFEPKLGKNFNDAMKVVSMNDLEMIPALYPFDRLAENGGLLVDVGGGLGQVGRKIVSYYAGQGLSCIVQDRVAQEGNNGEDTVVMQRHNFFDPQPVHGTSLSLTSSIIIEKATCFTLN